MDCSTCRDTGYARSRERRDSGGPTLETFDYCHCGIGYDKRAEHVNHRANFMERLRCDRDRADDLMRNDAWRGSTE